MDRLIEYFNRLVRAAVQPLAFAGLYPYSVVSCNKLMQTVSARALSAEMPDLTDVPIRGNGFAVEWPPGAQIRIGFDGMDPTAPYAIVGASGGLAPVIPNSGSGLLNELDCGYLVIGPWPGGMAPLPVPTLYFPAGVAGEIAATLANAAAPGSILVHLSGGRITPDPWTVP